MALVLLIVVVSTLSITALVVWAASVDLRRALHVSAVLAILQVFPVPIGGAAISLFSLWNMICASRVARIRSEVWRVGYIRLLISLLIVRLVYALFFSDDTRLGLKAVADLATFIVLIVLATSLVQLKGRAELLATVRTTIPFVLIQSLLVITFRVSPSLKLAALSNTIFARLSGPSAIANIAENGTTINDPGKSGGFLLNANVAGMLACAMAATLIVYGWERRGKVVVAVATISYLSIFFTGSKAATILAITLPILVAGTWAVARLGHALLPLAWTSTALIAYILYRTYQGSSFGEASATTFDSRTTIWSGAATMFTQHPIAGQGYGGWQLAYPLYSTSYGIRATLPPHNILIYAWSQTGLVGAGITMLLLAIPIKRAIQNVSLTPVQGCVTLVTSAWMLVQGSGENTDVFGDLHCAYFVAVLYALMYSPNICVHQKRSIDARSKSAGGGTAAPASRSL